MRKILLTLLSLIFTTNVYCAGNDILPRQYSVETAGQTVDSVSWNTLFYVPSYAVTKGIEYYIKDSEGKVLFAAAYNESAKSHSGKVSLNDIHSACDAAKITYKSDTAYNSVNNPQSDKNGVCMQMMSYFITQAQTYKDGVNLAHKGTPLTQEECQKVCMNSVGDNKCYWLQNAVTGNDAVKDKKGFCVGADGIGINFYPSCTGERKDNAGQCIKTFKGTQVQEKTGISLIYMWGTKHGLKLTCLPYRTENNQDYIECTANGQAYEFEFDDLEEPKDFLRIYDEHEAICAIYDLSFVQSTSTAVGVNDYCVTSNTSICKDIESNIKENLSPYYTIRASDNKCEIINNVDSGTKSCFGLDSRVFADIQIRATSNLDSILKQYVENKIGKHLSSFKCYSPSIKYTQNALGITVGQEIVPCQMTDSDGNTCTMNFEFDDLGENSDLTVKGDLSKMACDLLGGTHDGRKCNGLSKQQCDEASAKIPGGTRWDDEANACIVKEASKSQTINNINNVVAGIVITAVTVYVSGGSAIVVLVATAGSAALDGAFIGLERLQEINPHHRAIQFLTDSKICNTTDCAQQVVSNHFTRLGEVLDQLNDEEITTVSEEIDRISGLLTEDEFNAALSNTSINLEDKGLAAATPVLVAASILVAPEDAVKNLFAKAPKFASRMTRAAEHFRSLFNNDDKILESTTRINKLFDDIFGQKFAERAKRYEEIHQAEESFMAKNTGMFFHGSATDYKPGIVQTHHNVVDERLYATPNFYSARDGYALRIEGDHTPKKIKTYIIQIPKRFISWIEKNSDDALLRISDSTEANEVFSYVYAVNPTGFKNMGDHFYSNHDVEMVDRINIPVYSNVLVYPNAPLWRIEDIFSKMQTAAVDIDNNHNVLKNLQIYEEYLNKLSEILK